MQLLDPIWHNAICHTAACPATEKKNQCTDRWLNSKLTKFTKSANGTIAIMFSIAMPVIFLIAGFSVDYGLAVIQKERLQSAVDAGALATAKEMNLANVDDSTLIAIAQSVVLANLAKNAPIPNLSIAISPEGGSVQISASQNVKTYFGGVFGNKITSVGVTAEAIIVGSTRICVLALDDSASGAISAETQSRLTGNGCAVFSNSTSSNSIVAKNSAEVTASLVCSSGGVSGTSLIKPAPLTDCPQVTDPLADRPPPPIGACKESWLYVDTSVTLNPGVYCGGIQIANGAQVFLNPGVYVIKDGPLIVSGNAFLEGVNVGFYLTGSKAKFNFTPDSSISLTAPKDGPLAGLLMFEDINRKTAATHSIKSDDARLLLGTIYLPASNLVIDANSPIADLSAYTAIIVRTLKLYNGPHLVLNTNYSETEIPVPAGIKGTGNAVALSK